MDKNRVVAVAGVNDNPAKFGHKIFADLLANGYDVLAVGVRGGEVKGKNIYKTLTDLPKKPDIVITVVPPIGTDKIVDDCIALGIAEVWMQPGSESPAAIEKAAAAGMKVTNRRCFMVAEGIW